MTHRKRQDSAEDIYHGRSRSRRFRSTIRCLHVGRNDLLLVNRVRAMGATMGVSRFVANR